MPGWAKVLIIVAIVVVMMVVGLIVAGAYWWSQNKDALIARGKAQVTEGQRAGLSTDNQGCVDQTISRYKTEPGLTSAIAAQLFMQSCLPASRPTPGFCDEVPKATEFVKSSQWRFEQCKRVDLSTDQYCQQLFVAVQGFCENPRPFPQRSTPERNQ